MELKRIIARDTRSANEKAIQMYGQDVLIISSPEYLGNYQRLFGERPSATLHQTLRLP